MGGDCGGWLNTVTAITRKHSHTLRANGGRRWIAASAFVGIDVTALRSHTDTRPGHGITATDRQHRKPVRANCIAGQSAGYTKFLTGNVASLGSSLTTTAAARRIYVPQFTNDDQNWSQEAGKTVAVAPVVSGTAYTSAQSFAVGSSSYTASLNASRTCDELGVCQHIDLDCARTCQREALGAGMVDVPLPGLPTGNFWLEPPAPIPSPSTPTAAPLLSVTMQPTWRDTAWYLLWVAVTYVLFFAAAGYLWGKFGESASRAFWRVITGVS